MWFSSLLGLVCVGVSLEREESRLHFGNSRGNSVVKLQLIVY